MVDQLQGRVEKLSVSNVALPEKRAPGSAGVKQDFVCNLTALKLKPNVPFYKYDIRIYVVFEKSDGTEHQKELTKQTKDDFPEQERKTASVYVFKTLCKMYKDIFPQDSALFYDRAAVLFSAQTQLKLGGEEKQFKLPAKGVPSTGADAKGILVVIKKVTDKFQLTSNDLMKAVNVRDCEREKEILEVLTLAVSQKGYLETSQFVTYGSGVHYLFDHRALGFRDNELPELMDGKYMGIGVTKSVKVLEGEDGTGATPFVVTDVTKGAFHIDDQNLMEKISQMSIFFDQRTGQSSFSQRTAMQPHNQKTILQQIKGLYVRTTYGAKPRTFPIGNIARPASELKFEAADGSTFTVEQYFKKHYNIQLKYPWMFTVSERHKPTSYYPVELLRVAPSQRVTLQQQTPDQVASMIKASATLPQTRLHQTKVMKDALDINSRNPYLASAGITVNNDFATVTGRILPTPTILYGERQEVKPVDNCKWNGDRSRFLEPAYLSNWAVCATLTQFDARKIQVKDYVSRIEARCRNRGMQVDPVAEIFHLQNQSFEGLKEWYAAQKQKGRRYLMFITSDGIKQHDLIKLLEIEYQIVSQEVKGSKVDAVLHRNQNQTLDNVVAKINMKLGGVNYNVMLGRPNEPSSKWLTDKNRLFIGFEISNPPPLSKAEMERGATYKMPSVLGWGANCASNPQQYIGDYLYIQARQSDMMGQKLSEVVVDILKRFREATSVAPQHMVLYFSGISEGQFSLVTDTYMKAIHTGISSLSANYKPHITALAVSKDHNERIYKSKISGTRASEQNIPPGTVVDTKIVSPVINEFYLNAHSAFQGTAKTPKYSLLADDSKVPLDIVERMTHGLCFLHEIVTSTVSVPVPLIVADRCAKRGHNVFIANSGQGRSAVGSIDEANAKLVNHGELQKPTVGLLPTRQVALFPSTGCYSHDVMMREVGLGFPVSYNITWIQTFIYDFGFGIELMRNAGSLLWQQNVPTDFDRPWDLRGTFSFFKMLERHQTYCEKMLDDQRFLQHLSTQRVDVVVLDHFLQECMGGLTYLLNTSVVQFSNWPIADGYITSLNVPANPSAVPKTGTPFTGLGMTFGERVTNWLFHSVIVITRYIQVYVLERMFTRKGFPEVEIIRSEAERAIYAGRSEFLFDVVRPINNRVKHFGSISKMQPADYVTVLPEATSVGDQCEKSNCGTVSASASLFEQNSSNNSISDLPLSICNCSETKAATRTRTQPELYQEVTAAVARERFLSITKQFPELNWPSLVEKPFILVSFGSVAQAHYMPMELAEMLLDTFSRSPYTVIWQTNSAFESLLWAKNIVVPANVVISHWVPVKEMLAHPNLQYLICHGGINTINELLLFGVPVLGVHLQGDQGSNLRRLVDLGAAEMLSMGEISRGALLPAMRQFERNLDRYWKRAGQLSQMLHSYRRFHSKRQEFWIDWSFSSMAQLRSAALGDTRTKKWICLRGVDIRLKPVLISIDVIKKSTMIALAPRWVNGNRNPHDWLGRFPSLFRVSRRVHFRLSSAGSERWMNESRKQAKEGRKRAPFIRTKDQGVQVHHDKLQSNSHRVSTSAFRRLFTIIDGIDRRWC
ncbi:hypothetical protein Q1695_010465 [Nippostrongylus brasiliensis]|nr:hypothetical protein Q1695_010465 [Nippostrongylus brasiliensis]